MNILDTLDTLKRRWLALWIRCPKKAKTKGDILRYVLKHYLKYGEYGLCYEIRYALAHYEIIDFLIDPTYDCIFKYFPLFRKDIATRLFNGGGYLYWWPTEDWKSRYRYMKWLIKEYDGIKL